MANAPPLAGVRVVELAGLAPGPFASLILADYGASVLRIDRPHALAHSDKKPPPTNDPLVRHKSSICIDLKSPAGLSLLLSILKNTDVLIDPFRPGVLEKAGLSPSKLLSINKNLIIARLTGFRRDGEYSKMAGHDINYLAVSGVLSQLGRKGQPPYPPGNILADFAGGGLPCALGIIMALLVRERTGNGQVVENNMVDGAAYLGTFLRLGTKTPMWDQPRGGNLLDGGCPWYDVYECKDGGFMAVGALEPQFFVELIQKLGVDEALLKQRDDRKSWTAIREQFKTTFMKKTRMEWEEIFLGSDACCTPVLGQAELEAAKYEQRPPVSLGESPALGIDQAGAWIPRPLTPGSGGEDLLKEWMGLQRGKDFNVENGSLVKAKL
ncbi:MAG: hypothetical protein MMC33_002428 [Icmadophila ericetorum]|nr:hypothetical protein [Icmadophila ericetorum]